MAVETYLRAQAGVISRAQALAAGLSRDAVDHRIGTRRWQPVHPRVYLAAGYDLDAEARVRAAVLWAGPGAVLTGRAAAWWHGLLREAPDVVTAAVPRGRRASAREGVTRCCREFTATDLEESRGLLITGSALTVLDTAVELGAAGAQFLDRAIVRGASWRELADACPAAAGQATARALLRAVDQRARDAARRRLVRALREARVGGWSTEVDVRGHAVALGFPRLRVAVEVRGWAADATTTSVPVRVGWTTVPVEVDDALTRPAEVVASIVQAVTST